MKPLSPPFQTDGSKLVLAVGADDDRDWPEPLRRCLEAHRVVHVPWGRLSAAFLGTLTPETVVTPLLGARFDALEVAAWFAEQGFAGRLVVVVGRRLPDAGLVQREISAAGGGLRVDLLACD